MVTQSLIDYIKTRASQKTAPEEIKQALLKAGWALDDIESAWRSVVASDNLMNLEVEPAQPPNSALVDETQNKQGKEPAIDLFAQIEVKPEIQTQSLPTMSAEPVLEIKQAPAEIKAEPETKNLEAELQPAIGGIETVKQAREENAQKQKKVLLFVFNVLFGVSAGIGLTLGIQFALTKILPQAQPLVSPVPSIPPQPLVLSLAETPYKNTDLGIELLYPDGWRKNIDVQSGSSSTKSIIFESDDLASINVRRVPINPSEKNIALEKISERAQTELKLEFPDYISTGQIKSVVSDLPAYITDGSYSFQPGLGLKIKVLQVAMINEKREFYVEMRFSAKSEYWIEYRPVYEQIISSFKLSE
ncbi:MAG: hypothetical protein UX26_C0038G0001 [Parcubacteria group bacterium GW2011_GWC1_45_9]|nr:MAG: hypothetical protein UX26_C0038G0001 [Parcubacteria group bacterium GW2011_GWC1_45_9]